MAQIDPKTFFTALAFVAVAIKKKDDYAQDEAERVRQLAGYVEQFCTETTALPPPPDDPDAAAIDRMIEHHARQLKEKEETRLPTDRATLIKLHDRLNYRNLRRLNGELYPTLSTAKLADFVLSYLDEEIEHSGDGGGA